MEAGKRKMAKGNSNRSLNISSVWEEAWNSDLSLIRVYLISVFYYSFPLKSDFFSNLVAILLYLLYDIFFMTKLRERRKNTVKMKENIPTKIFIFKSRFRCSEYALNIWGSIKSVALPSKISVMPSVSPKGCSARKVG